MNRPELARVIGFIEANPEQHDQTIYARHTACGTAACLAEWTCLLNGYEIDWHAGRESSQLTSGKSIPCQAQQILDVTTTEAAALFAGDNTIDEIKLIAKEIENGTFDYAQWIVDRSVFADEPIL